MATSSARRYNCDVLGPASDPAGELPVPRKQDLRKVDHVAKEFGIDRDAFGEYLHQCKESGDKGSGPRGDYSMEELREKAREFLEFEG